MRKVLMWAVGVPFLVLGMVMVSFSDGGQGLSVAHQTTVRGS